jgi:addiction module HigA family antidote
MTDIQEIPDWISPPGETIIDILEERGWTQAELAERTGFTRKHINQLIKGNASITEETALKLERVLGSTAGFWLSREAQYRESIARQSELNDLKADVGWLAQLPVADMIRFGWIKRYSERVRQVAECLRYFGVASVAAWKEKYENMVLAYRASDKFDRKQGSVTAWIRYGEREAETVDCANYQRSVLETNLATMRCLVAESDPVVFLPRLKELCCASGIVLVIAPTPKGCPVSGITRWLQPDKALVMLSLRYKSNDHFWFTFFHEIAHLILHGKKMMFLELHDGLDDKSEDEANRWAANFLIPTGFEKQLVQIDMSENAIQQFAATVGVPSGIVVGRLQKDKRIPWNTTLNSLKIFYKWFDDEEYDGYNPSTAC